MINYEVSDGIATITWDMDRPQNVINAESYPAFSEAINRALQDQSVTGVIITSGKRDFHAGADLHALMRLSDAQQVMEFCAQWHEVNRKIETGGKPFVAAINGSALGGGYELCLSCHHRIASNHTGLRIGFPEIKLGLFPGGGGTQRLPRMIGLRAAAKILLEGQLFDAKTAFDRDLIDGIATADGLIDAARAWLMSDAADSEKPWDKHGFKIPGGDVWSQVGMQSFTAGNALLHAKTKGNYPAHQAIMSCLYEGLQVPIDLGLQIESRWFANVLLGNVAKNMIRTFFFHMKDANKLVSRPRGNPVTTFQTVGILGAGMMGAGIAHAAVTAGLDVTLLDTTLDRANRGKDYCQSLFSDQIKHGHISEQNAKAMLKKLNPTTDFADFADAQLIIEAVFEDRDVKGDVTRKTEAIIKPEVVFASNTSTLPITSLAETSQRPANFIGLHFFSPVHRMKLVEIIRGKETSDSSLALAMDFVKLIGKTPIVVNDSRGFYTSRVFSTYVQEGMALLAEGVVPALIENAGRLAGMPLGPLAVADEVSLELIYRVSLQTKADLGDVYMDPPGIHVIKQMVKELGRLGKKTSKGFYDYPSEAPKHLWPGLADRFPQNLSEEQPSVELVKKRLLYIQAIETVHCLDENVVTTPADADIGSVLGWGFAPHTGGVVSMVDTIGVATFVAECDLLAQQFGVRFTPTAGLRERAQNDQRFYSPLIDAA